MDAFSNFLSMGGYAGYVWSAFGIGTLVMAALVFQSLHALHRHEAALATLREGAQHRPGKGKAS